MNEDRKYGYGPVVPGIAPEVAGAPVTMPGGNDGTDKSGKMAGTTPKRATVSPAVDVGLSGAPGIGASASTSGIGVSAGGTAVGASAASQVTDSQSSGGNAAESGGNAVSETQEAVAGKRPESDQVSPGDAKPSGNATSPEVDSSEDEEEKELLDGIAGTDRQIRTVQDWMDSEEHRLETDEERKKREKRERSKRIIAAVTDGLSALSNLYFTSQYAPNMYEHSRGSQSEAVDARIERIKAEREKREAEHLNFALRLGDLENQRAKTLQDLKAAQEKRKLARKKAEQEDELHPVVKAIKEAEQRKKEQEAEAARLEAENKPAALALDNGYKAAGIEQRKAAAGASKASAANSYASAAAHNRSNPKEFYAWDKNGRRFGFRSKDAAERFARQQGTWVEEDVTETSETTGDNGDSTTTKTKKGGYPASPPPKDNTPPSRRKNNDNTPLSRR